MKPIPLTVLLGVVFCGAALAENAPRIQFEKTVYDFGRVSRVESVSGKFKFKNMGDGVLILEPPKPTCGCTIAEIKPDKLQPGESGELPFTLNLGRYRATMEKHISIKSNDPKTPEVILTLKAEFTPLYDMNPMALAPHIPFGVKSTNEFATITRTDGKPLGALKFSTSKAWITAKLEPTQDASRARIRVEIQPDGFPRRFNEFVNVYASDQTNHPVSTLFLYGSVVGDLAVSPEALYWSVTDSALDQTEQKEQFTTKRATIRSVNGKKFELKNPQSTLTGIAVELIRKPSGAEYEIVAKLNDFPNQTLSGDVRVETSSPLQPKIDLPVIVNVFKP